MQPKIDLNLRHWTLAGWTPNLWQFATSMETGNTQQPEIPAFAVTVPGSVQGALQRQGLLPDMYTGFNARLCEWVENRHWCFTCEDEFAELVPGRRYRLVLPGVDASGWVRWDGRIAARFDGAHRPHTVTLGEAGPGRHRLEIIFDAPPRFCGQFGRTESMPVTKPRFYYTWDWIPRMVQIGLTRAPYLEDCDAPRLKLDELWTGADTATCRGRVRLQGELAGADAITVTLRRGEQTIRQQNISATAFQDGVELVDLPVELWYPNLSGEAVLYELELDAGDAGVVTRRVGFKQIRWLPCPGAPAGADPWVCEINGQPTFLQGVNWTPIRPYFADVTEPEYRARLESYRDIGCNVLRVWGGASLEAECFYRLCDELGLLLWQEFPLSSSGLNNTPPADAESIAEMERIADHYLRELSGHAALLAWSGGNELQRGPDGGTEGCGRPCTVAEPMLTMLHERVSRRDPSHRFMATSASGPRECAETADYGQGLHWEVHGPWRWDAPLRPGWFQYWDGDDALFRAEFGCPGASDAALIRRHAGAEASFPCTVAWWRYPLDWWAEHDVFEQETGRPPVSLEEYVAWSQTRQAEALVYAVTRMKRRFPGCGGAILWMGHDSFPCAANTSLLDFDGKWKPAARALAEVFHAPAGSHRQG